MARQERSRRETEAASARHVFTNDDVAPAKPGDAAEPDGGQPGSGAASQRSAAAEKLRAKVLAYKQRIKELQARIDEIGRQIDPSEKLGDVPVGQRVLLHGTGMGDPGPGFCARSQAIYFSPYKEYCDRPERLAAEREVLQAELNRQRTALAEIQEQARKQGYRSAVYDPE
jgi:cell division protein FtsB